MPRYSFRAYDRDGARLAGELVAATREGALETIVRRGHFPVDIREDGESRAHLPWWQREVFGGGSLPLPALALLTREITSLLKADLPVDECLRLVGVQPMLPARLRQTVKRVEARVVQGESLSAALASEGPAFPEYYWRLVRAGEASGSLADCLDDLAVYLERSQESRAKIVSALLYPAVLIVAACAAVGVIMAILLPAIMPIFEEAGAEPPALLKALRLVQETLADHWAIAFLSTLGAVIGMLVALQSDAFRRAADRFMLRLPVAGSLIERRCSGRLARTLATLLRNGVPLMEAVRISSGVLPNRALRGAVERAVEEIKEGGQLSAPLARSGLFSELLLRLAIVGEQSGQLDQMLLRAAEIYESALQRQMQRLTSLITPVVTLVIGVVVGGLVLTVMSALISVNDLAIR
jgi:general secretion pathway protein F